MDVEKKKNEIETLGLNAIEEYFKIDLKDLEPEILKHLHNRARLGMQFEREISISKRAVEMNYLRVFKMLAEDKKELKKWVKKKMPKYTPI